MERNPMSFFGYMKRAFLLGALLLSSVGIAHAGMLFEVSDLISSSNPNAWANHTVTFQVQNAVPALGTIVITPEPGAFTIPAPFDFTDVDMAISTTSTSTNYVDQDVAALASGTEIGVSVVTGASGQIVLTMSSGSGLSAGDRVEIELGSHATYGVAGDQRITNPAGVGSYQVDVETTDAGSVEIDSFNALVFIIDPVEASAETINNGPPVRLNGLPTGLLPGGTVNVLVSLETDEAANCRYDTVPGTSFAAMPGVFQNTASSTGRVHTESLAGTVDGTTYSFYVRCQDFSLLENTDDYLIEFEIGLVPTGTSTGYVVGAGGSGGTSLSSGVGGIYPSGGNFLDTAQVTLDGRAYPGSQVTVLQDGEVVEQFSVSGNGSFNTRIDNLQRGTYTFGLYALDGDGRKSSIYSSTIALSGQTGNLISQIYIPPTIEVGADTLNAGDTLSVFGVAVPDSVVLVTVEEQGGLLGIPEILATTTAGSSGSWSSNIDTIELENKTYIVKARASVEGGDYGDWSKYIFIGIGGEPEPDLGIFADLNRDGFVNITDFSILMFHWATDGGTSDPPADINQDGNVNIADFSIMMFHWTG